MLRTLRTLRTIEKYDLLEEIGQGGMATVYRARDTRLDRLVAIKVMHPHLHGAKEARVRFSREAQSVARLRHPNILEIYDSSSPSSEESFIVTELLTGPTLKAFGGAHPSIPAEIAACFGIELAKALGAAHRAGVVHRDVKPENVLLHEDRCIKLTDFGIAQMVDAQSFTATGQILGSPGHMAPEQIEGGHCDARTDVFSLGTVLYYLATGVLPFVGRNPHQILKRIVDGEFVDPIRVRATIGGRLRKIIVRALSKAPADRYPDAAAMEADLRAFVAEAGITDSARTLAAYLSDPVGTAETFGRELIARLIGAGEDAAARREVALALDHFNRVLALDENNVRVLARVKRISRRGQTRTSLVAAGVVLGVIGIAAMTFAALRDAPSENGSDPRLAISTAGPAVGPLRLSAESSAASRAPEHPRSTGDPSRGSRQDVHPAEAPSENNENDRSEAIEPHPGFVRAPRTVVLSPTPRNVTIAVDGAAPRAFGPSFRQLDLAPGTHTFRVEAAGRCCEVLETTRAISAGRDLLTLDLVLALRPASLLVRTNVPADLVIDAGRVRARTIGVVRVPMDRPERPVTFSVTAPDHESYTGTAWLRAGELTSLEVELASAPAAP